MQKQHNSSVSVFRKTAIAAAVASVVSMGVTSTAVAQEGAIEEVVITGIRGSLKRAIDVKRDASGVVDSIAAEDLGKFPDLNVAESLQRIPGVSIDRSGGEGQAITVRGLGPQFNTVLLNGRQIANDSGGREFNFDTLAAEQISGADVFKSGRSDLQEGGIGATVNVKTAKPFDKKGLQLAGSLKGMYESLSEEISPSVSLLASNTFADDRIGLLAGVSYQKRDVQINQVGTAGWRPGLTLSNNAGDADPTTSTVLATNAYLPRNWDQVVDQQDRTRKNLNLVFQYAATDDLTVTVDGFYSKFEVDSLVTDLASWFEPDRVGAATVAANGTAIAFNQIRGLNQGSGDPASDFVSTTRNSRDSSLNGFGINLDWDISERLEGSFDLSTSSAENDRAGKDRFNVVGIINDYSFDGTGSLPTVTHAGFDNGNLPDINRSRLHYNEKGNVPTDEDDITELKFDFEYSPDSDSLESVKFGAYRQGREKSQFQIFGNQCAFCGYGTVAPVAALDIREFTANNFFPGLIDTFYTYDGDAYVQYLADQGFPITPALQNNRYTINEDITSFYADFTFGFEIGASGMPLEINAGARYADTDIDVDAIQSFIVDVVPTTDLTLFSNVLGPATNINEGDSYNNFLSNISAKLDVRDDMVVRFAAYESLTRATMSELSPATNFGQPRRQNLTASGGNPALKPFTATNFDLSYEWYYNDSSAFSLAYFRKDINDIIVNLTGTEQFELTNRSAADGFRCTGTTPSCAAPGSIDPANPTVDVIANTEELNGQFETYTVNRPRNGESAVVDGFEIALTHVWDNGFGVSANGTFVDSDLDLGDGSSSNFGLEGLGDSQNLVVFYENERMQARIAYNNRDEFLRLVDNGFNGEPINTDAFSQIDISASYNLSDRYTLFFEGINITEEELRQTGRFANQVYSIEDNGSRYAFGIRGVW